MGREEGEASGGAKARHGWDMGGRGGEEKSVMDICASETGGRPEAAFEYGGERQGGGGVRGVRGAQACGDKSCSIPRCEWPASKSAGSNCTVARSSAHLRRALETSPELSQASVATRLHGLFNAAGRRRVAGRAGGALRSNWSPAQTPLAKIAFGAAAFWNRPQPFREPLRVMLVEECEHAVRMDLAGAVTSYPELRQGATRKAMPRC